MGNKKLGRILDDFKKKYDVLKILIGFFLNSKRIYVYSTSFGFNFFAFFEIRFNLFYKNDNNKKIFKTYNSFVFTHILFKYLVEIFTYHLKKPITLNSIFQLNLKNEALNLKVGKNKTRQLQFSINSSIHIIKQEILKLNQIEQQLGYFELSINSIGIVHHKLKKKIVDLQQNKKNYFTTNSIFFEFIFLVIIITFLFYCWFFFI